MTAMPTVLATVPCPDGLDCRDLHVDDVCDELVCETHNADVRLCVEGGVHCDDDCASRCGACTSADVPCSRKDGFR